MPQAGWDIWRITADGSLSQTWRVFAFWMGFQSLFQSLSQLAIGTLIPGNDVGRSLA